MKNILEYKGYHAKIEFDEEDMLFVGEIYGIKDSINFHGTTIQELVDSFHESIDNYFEICKEIGKNPDKEYKGSFNVRIDRELHREAAFAADRDGITLNQYVENAIRKAVSREENGPTYILALSDPPTLIKKHCCGEILSHYERAGKVYRQEGAYYETGNAG